MEWISEAIGFLTTIAGSFIGFWVGRRKSVADAQSTELENVKKAIVIWQETAEKLQMKVDDLEKRIQELQLEVETVHAENLRLKRSIID